MRDKGKRAIEKKGKALERLSITYVPLSQLHPNTYNPNRQNEHEFELLQRSMREDGFTQPVIAMEDGTIVDGEHRWRAADALGFTEVPVVYVKYTPEQMRIATLRHNRARGSEDVELSAAVLRDLRELGALDWAQDSLMIDDVELQRLIEDVPTPQALAGEEYADAWEPGGVEGGVDTGQRTVGMTPAAVSRMREQERRVQSARNEEERIAARRDSNIYRLSLIFAGEEADIIRKVLGDKPAERLLEMCRATVK